MLQHSELLGPQNELDRASCCWTSACTKQEGLKPASLSLQERLNMEWTHHQQRLSKQHIKLWAAQSKLIFLNLFPGGLSESQASTRITQDADTGRGQKQEDLGVKDCIKVLDLWLQKWDSYPQWIPLQ